jgi:peptide/nickel transport system substrate-binding protein
MKIFLLILAIFFLAACKRYTAKADPETVVYPLYEDVKDWDPATAYSLETMALGNIYEPLHWFVPDSSGYHFRPGLATSYTRSDDGLSWVFNLRQNVLFHDGTPFTAHAVKKTIERVKRIGKGASFIWDAVKNIETPNDSTVIFRLSAPAPIDLIAASQYSSWIMSPAIADCTESYFRAGKASGTGPYKLTSWEPNGQILMEKFPDYWNGWPGDHFKKVKLKVISEPGTRVQMIRSGEIDFAGLVPTDNMAAMYHNKDLNIEVIPSWRNMMFLLNTSKPPLDNILVRRAILHAFDYRAAIEFIFEGYASHAKAPVPQNMWGVADSLQQPEFNLEKAKDLLRESKVNPEELELTLAYVASVEVYEKCAVMLQNNLAKIGVKLNLEPGLWNVLWEKAKNKKTAPHLQSMTWWPSYPTPGDWLYGLFATQKPNLFNLSHYNHPAFDKLVLEALALEGTDRTDTIKKYKAAQKMLYDDAVAIFFADLKVRLVTRKSVRGITPNPAYEMIYFYNLYRIKENR